MPGCVVLFDKDLIAAIKSGELKIDPFDPRLVQPASIDVRLGHTFRVFNTHKHQVIDPFEIPEDLTTLVSVASSHPFILHPGQFVLGGVWETVEVQPTLAARIEGKSSLGRHGLIVHSTAGWVDPGWEGRLTLEISNIGPLPIKLWPAMRVGQLCVFRGDSPAERPYGPERGSHYQGQNEPQQAKALGF